MLVEVFRTCIFQSEFFENLFPLAAKRGGKSYDLLYKNSIRKYEDELEHKVIYILHDF